MTKLIPLSILALVASVGAAAADNTFTLDRSASDPSTVVLTDVSADAAGSIEIYDYEDGSIGQLLGYSRISPGAIGTLEVTLSQPAEGGLFMLQSNGNYAVSTLTVREPLTN